MNYLLLNFFIIIFSLVIRLNGMENNNLAPYTPYLPTIDDDRGIRKNSGIKSHENYCQQVTPDAACLLECKDGIIPLTEKQLKTTYLGDIIKDLKDQNNKDCSAGRDLKGPSIVPVPSSINSIKLYLDVLEFPKRFIDLSVKEKKQLVKTVPWLASKNDNGINLSSAISDIIYNSPGFQKDWIDKNKSLLTDVYRPISKKNISSDQILYSTNNGVGIHIKINDPDANTLDGVSSTINNANLAPMKFLGQILLHELKNPIRLNVKNNPLKELVKKCYNLQLLRVEGCTIPVIPQGTFVDVRDGTNIIWKNNQTVTVKQNAFTSWNNGFLNLQNNPLTPESCKIVMADTQGMTTKEVLVNLRAMATRTYNLRFGFGSIVINPLQFPLGFCGAWGINKVKQALGYSKLGPLNFLAAIMANPLLSRAIEPFLRNTLPCQQYYVKPSVVLPSD